LCHCIIIIDIFSNAFGLTSTQYTTRGLYDALIMRWIIASRRALVSVAKNGILSWGRPSAVKVLEMYVLEVVLRAAWAPEA